VKGHFPEGGFLVENNDIFQVQNFNLKIFHQLSNIFLKE